MAREDNYNPRVTPASIIMLYCIIGAILDAFSTFIYGKEEQEPPFDNRYYLTIVNNQLGLSPDMGPQKTPDKDPSASEGVDLSGVSEKLDFEDS